MLLSYGSGTISDLVRLIDGGQYSHSALYDGTKIIEAGLSGVVTSTLAETLSGQKYVDVYRFRTDNNQGFSMPDFPTSPVSTRAHYYLDKGTQYANNQLYLLGVLLVLRNKKTDPIKKKKFKTIVSMVYKLMKRIVSGKEVKAVICSELVYRCFDEASANKKYGLSIPDMFDLKGDNQAAKSQAIETANDELDQELQGIREMLLQINPDLTDDSNNLLLVRSSNPLVAPELVSPYDLECSANLIKIGRLSPHD